MAAIQYILYFGIIVTTALSILYSIKYRRTPNPRTRGINQAKMNVCMGLTLIIVAIIQLYLFADSSIRVVVGVLFLLVGLFNLFAGIRNHSFFSRLKE
jgi:hypothetical protein